MLLLAVAFAGALGAVSRATVDVNVRAPLAATFAINVTGSFVFGILTGLALYHGLGSDARTIAGTGFCGGYTTFSTFAWQTVTVQRPRAARYAAASVIVPTAAAAIGLAITAW
jgi:CrcB protein